MESPETEIGRLESLLSSLRNAPQGFGAGRRIAHLLVKLAGLYEAAGRADKTRSALGSAIDLLTRLKGPLHPVVLELKTYLDQAPGYLRPGLAGEI
jgi:hypothetical protein